ncbi:DUF4112 domain-containing protein [Desulfococcus multivorans]|uniref:DUF4112 domain-containing protein n=1 Tax=Desulfococcus multivorans DSM 2059 TaxID=1121405 RepID=S7T639_DESML|nr:DUF4112 domain-containing protein [Desulfococcus multivorans]AOY56962.1 uncharacterized protein Dmul_01860 [Desulfococcus multivorans]AQU99483.1 hypothetical protein B2D07_00940 [Desulfococcus multivorans]EPR32532.1 Protein of unknown function DUF4112 [Desulfococcus multivorans DSM 2059]SKA29353.1 protein of unknown function [Desulfococcus multivorans DSM 2059]
MNPNKQKELPHSSVHSRMQRLRSLSRLLDSAFPLPGGFRIGLDGIIGLIPGFGDIAGSIASSYIIVESARLGASTATLLRMVMNVLVESLIGLVPFLGDLFDIVWKANEKNMALMEKQLAAAPPGSSPETRLKAAVFIILGLMLAGVAAIAYLGFTLLFRLVAALQGAGGA